LRHARISRPGSGGERATDALDDRHITVADLATGEVLSTHQIDPTQDLRAQPAK
jgi:hypothetical protein